jgi:hypothetical protein
VFHQSLDWTVEMTTIPSTAAAIADAVRSGVLKATDVLEAHLARIAEREGEIHAFNLVTTDEARAAAARIDADVAAGRDPGVLAGVPIAIKDNMCTRGIATTCSSKILEGWRPPYDATVVQRLAAAGAVTIGKTMNLLWGQAPKTRLLVLPITRATSPACQVVQVAEVLLPSLLVFLPSALVAILVAQFVSLQHYVVSSASSPHMAR